MRYEYTVSMAIDEAETGTEISPIFDRLSDAKRYALKQLVNGYYAPIIDVYDRFEQDVADFWYTYDNKKWSKK